MKATNIKSLESLSLFCHLTGLFSVFIGIVVVFISVINEDLRFIQAGIYIFATGYASTKISKKITHILYDEVN